MFSYCKTHRRGARRRAYKRNMGIIKIRFCEVTNSTVQMFFDFRDGEYTVRHCGEDISDLAALTMKQYPAVVELGQIAYQLNRGR